MTVGVGDAVIPISPDLSGFAKQLERGLEQMVRRSGNPAIAFDVDERRFAQSIDQAVARVGTVDIDVDADVRDALSEIERVSQDQPVQLDATVDDAGVRQALDRLSRDRDVTIDVGVDRAGLAGDVEAGLEAGAEDATGSGGGFRAALTGGITAIVGGAIVAGFDAVTEVFDREQSADLLGASLGLSDERAADLGRQAAEVYVGAWGESVGEVTAVFGEAIRQLPAPLSNWDVRTASEDALTIRDVWGKDVNETLKAVGQTLRNDIADTQEEAFDAIAFGMQTSVDRADDLLETLDEYSTDIGSIGFDLETTVAVFQRAMDRGAWNTDRLGDALRELSINAIDDTEEMRGAYENLGLDFDTMAGRIAEGGESAREASSEIIQALSEMEEGTAKNATGMAFFRTMWEELGPEIIAALDPAEASLEGFRGTMDSVTQQAYDNVNTRLTGAWRRFTSSIPSALDEAGAIEAIDRILDAFDEDGLAGAIDQVQEEWDAAWPYIARFLHETVVPTLGQIGAAAAAAFATELVTGLLNKVQEIANFVLGGQTIGDQFGLGDLVNQIAGLAGGGEDTGYEMPPVFGMSSGEQGFGSGPIRALAHGAAVPEPMLAIVGDNTDPLPEVTSPVPLMQDAFRQVLAEVGTGGPVYQITAMPGDDQVEQIVHKISLHDAAREVGPNYMPRRVA